MKRIYSIFTVLLSILLLTSCNSGTQRTDIGANTYGKLIKYEVLPSYTNFTDMQQNLKSRGICNNLVLTGPDDQTTVCNNLNIKYINDNTNLFGAANGTSLDSTGDFISKANVSSINAVRLIYTTPGQAYHYSGNSPSKERVSGLVLIPTDTNGNMITNPKGVLLYFHPTTFGKHQVPSNITSTIDPDPSADNGDYMAYIMASIYASHGYIVVDPDYLGQGVNVDVIHPYAIYPQTNALSGIYMLSAANEFLNQQYPEFSKKLTKLNLFISSYSEGGAYAVWASRLLQNEYKDILINNNLNLKMTIGISGAYDLSGTQVPYAYHNTNNYISGENNYNSSPGAICDVNTPIFGNYCKAQIFLANINMAGSKAALAVYAFTAFINYEFNNAAYDVFFKNNSNFLTMNNTCIDLKTWASPINGKPTSVACPYNGVSLNSLFTKDVYNGNLLTQQLYLSAMGATYSKPELNFLTSSDTYSAYLSGILTNKQVNNSVGVFANNVMNDQGIMNVIKKADTWKFNTNSPITLIDLKYDSIVTNLNTKKACDDNGISPHSLLQCIEVDNTNIFTFSKDLAPDVPIVQLFLEHGSAEFILNLIALNKIEQIQ